MNARSVLGSRFCGRGRSEIKSMCAMLDLLLPISSHTFVVHTPHIGFILSDMADIQQKEPARILKSKRGCGPNDALDVTVTCDCTCMV